MFEVSNLKDTTIRWKLLPLLERKQNVRKQFAVSKRISRGKGETGNGDRYAGSPWSIHRLTLELVTVGDFALPVAGLFVQVKGQPAGTRDLLQAGFRAPVRIGQKANGTPFN